MSYVRYEDLGKYSSVDVNITRLNNLPRPEYWNNPLRRNRDSEGKMNNIQETIHLAGIFPQQNRTKVLVTKKNENTLIWFPAPDFNVTSQARQYWKPACPSCS